MSEIENDPGVEIPVAEPEYSEIEREAIEMGWNPEGVDGKKNLTAEEFIDRKPLYDEIRQLRKGYKEMKAGVEALADHNKRIEERTREQVIAELKMAKREALENEDYDAVLDIDDRIAETRAEPIDTTPKVNHAFENWVEKNPWYNQDPELREYADMLGDGYFRKNPNKDLEAVYAYVAAETKKRYPEKFGHGDRRSPSVEGASKGRSTGKRRYSARDLPEQDRQIMKTIVRASGGKITEEEYLKQYFG